MELDLVRSYKVPNGETVTYTDVVIVDGVNAADPIILGQTVNQQVSFAVPASRCKACFVAANTPVTVAVNGTCAVQTVTLGGSPTGGTFTLTYAGQTTTGIAYNATAATVQTALQALSTIGPNNVAVTGSAGGPWTVTFVGTLAIKPITTMTGSAASLTGGTPTITLATTVTGVVPTWTWTFPASVALDWAAQDGFFSSPVSSDIVNLWVTNPATIAAKLQLRFGINVS
jgi:hypothetical protein